MARKPHLIVSLQIVIMHSVIILASIVVSYSRDQSGFISIDCGATAEYTDPESGIFYQTDKDFIDGGENSQISSEITASTRFLQDLRSFPEGVKNCYTLNPKQGKNNMYLIRARFLYGNYDGKKQAPTFDLYVGVNKWTTIDPGGAEEYLSWWEIILFPPTDYIPVCLVRTSSGVPFISSLELRLLSNTSYNPGSSLALDVYRRFDLGLQTSGLVRYKGDNFDRLWRASLRDFMDCFGDCKVISNNTLEFLSSDDPYKPPPEVLRSASGASNGTNKLGFSFTLESYVSQKLPMYFYLHFAEIEKLKLKRKMSVSSGGKTVHEPFTLDYLVPKTIGPIVLPISGRAIQFDILSNNESGLPPILNGYEVYRVIDYVLGATDSKDVDAIMNIKATYNLTKNWRGDPCVDSFWDGVNCTLSTSPRILSLNLNSNGLTGIIASAIANLTMLQSLDLSGNKLTGPVPEFLSSLPSMKYINLAGNNLIGVVPEALLQKSTTGTLTLRLDGNPGLCSLGSCNAKNHKKLLVPVVASASVLILAVAIALAVWWTWKTKGSKKADEFSSTNKMFAYSQVASITRNFETEIGRGGFGKVYLGTLKNGLQVAVKLLSSESEQGSREFRREVNSLMRVHHRNVLSLVGYCSDPLNLALIYEYMPNGNLKQHLSGSHHVLSLKDRVQIAVDAAQGLDYLHNSCFPCIVHCDLKTSNILLDKNMQAKLADFGLSKTFEEDATHVTTMGIAGTPGYVDPELALSAQVSRRSDVYSFGVVLLELVTGKPALLRGADVTSLISWVLPKYKKRDILNIVDPRLQGNFNTDAAHRLLEISVSCVHGVDTERPDIRYVLAELKTLLLSTQEDIINGSTSGSVSNQNSYSVSFVPSLDGRIGSD